MKFKTPIIIFFISRTYTFLLFIFAVFSYMNIYSEQNFFNAFYSVLGQWDSHHYYVIAQKGYISDYLAAWFPLYPVLIKSLTLLHIDIRLAASLISNISLFVCLIYFYNLVSMLYSGKTALYTLLLFSFSPLTFFYSIPYTESLFLMFTVMSCYYILDKKWLAASIFAALSSATRNSGVFIAIPMIFMFYDLYIRNRNPNIKVLTGDFFRHLFPYLVITASGVIIFMVHLYFMYGDPLMFVTVQKNWNNSIVFPFWDFLKHLKNFTVEFQLKFTGDRVNMSFLYTLFSIFLLIYGYNKINRGLFYYSVITLIYLNSINHIQASNGRYISNIFPVWILFALWVLNKQNPRFLLFCSMVIMSYWQIYLIFRWVLGSWVQ